MTFHSEKGMECHHPNWLSLHQFFRGVGIPPTRLDFLLVFRCSPHRIPKSAPGSQCPQCFTEASQRFTWLSFTLFRPKHWAVTGWILFRSRSMFFLSVTDATDLDFSLSSQSFAHVGHLETPGEPWGAGNFYRKIWSQKWRSLRGPPQCRGQ